MEAKTEEYLVHKWTKGEVINEANLNNIEQGLKKSTDAIRSLETAAVEVETLEAGEQATAQYDAASNTWYFAVPKGDQGKQGLQGAQGEQGAKGDTGERGLQGAQGPAGELALKVTRATLVRLALLVQEASKVKRAKRATLVPVEIVSVLPMQR